MGLPSTAVVATLALVVLGACDDEASDVAERPELDDVVTWHWQLQGELDTSHDVDLYGVDLFDTRESTIDELHDDGRLVMCYFSAGTAEDWRPDVEQLDEDDIGRALDDWEGERWLDVRSPSVRQLMLARLDLAARKGCDAVEPDNVTAFANDTGFDITARDQLDFVRALANAAHERGVLFALKNDLEQVDELVDDVDLAVNEQCHEFDECDAYAPFRDRGKPVLNAEYATRFLDDPDELCRMARTAGTSTLLLPVELDGSFRIACDE